MRPRLFASVHSCGFPFDRGASCSAGRERVIYIERLARSMGSDDDMFRIWSGPEGSSHKEPLSGIRIHRAHGRFWCRGYPRVPAGRLVSRWSSASPAGSLDYQAPCRHSRVADQNRLKGHIYLIIESLALCRSLALPKHRLLRALGASDRRPCICNELLTHLQGSPYYHESD